MISYKELSELDTIAREMNIVPIESKMLRQIIKELKLRRWQMSRPKRGEACNEKT